MLQNRENDMPEGAQPTFVERVKQHPLISTLAIAVGLAACGGGNNETAKIEMVAESAPATTGGAATEAALGVEGDPQEQADLSVERADQSCDEIIKEVAGGEDEAIEKGFLEVFEDETYVERVFMAWRPIRPSQPKLNNENFGSAVFGEQSEARILDGVSDEEEDKVWNNFRTDLCQDPMRTAAWLNKLANNPKLAEYNNWLAEFAGDPNKGAVDRIAKELSSDTDEAYERHQELAGMVATLLSRFDKDLTITNLMKTYVVKPGEAAGGVPPVRFEERSLTEGVLRFTYTNKEGKVSVAETAIIDCDLQPAEEEVPVVTTTTTRPGRGTTTTTGKPVGTTTHTSPPTTIPQNVPTTTTTAPDKDPANDYNQPDNTSPNADSGSGGDPGPEGITSTTGVAPETTIPGEASPTTIDATDGDPTPSTAPAGECGAACD